MAAGEDPAQAPPKQRQRRRKKRRSQPPQPEGPGLAVMHALEALSQALLEARGLSLADARAIGALTLPVEFDLTGDATQRARNAARLAELVRARLDASVTARAAYLRGHVYCFRCSGADCVHSLPPSTEHSFARYSATGQPEWQDLPNLCLDRGVRDADRLFRRPAGVVAMDVAGEDLTDLLLDGFGKGDMGARLHGQVAVGLVQADFSGPATGDGPRLALTVQIIETRGGRGTPRLRTNVLGDAWDTLALAASEADPRHPAERLRRAVMTARHQVEELGRRAAAAERQGGQLDLGALSAVILERLRADAERIYRSDTRRTGHARARHEGAERPTASAWKDAERAADERLLFDVRHNTVVVVGSRGRTHLFSDKGKHVTSFFLEPGELERKTSRDRWRPMPVERIAAFRAALQAQGQQTG